METARRKFTKPLLLFKDISDKIFVAGFEGDEDCSSAIGLYDERIDMRCEGLTRNLLIR